MAIIDSPQPLTIQSTWEEMLAAAMTGDLDTRSLAIIIEAGQKFLEYLDSVLDFLNDFDLPASTVVDLGGTKVKFPTDNQLIEFLTERIYGS